MSVLGWTAQLLRSIILWLDNGTIRQTGALPSPRYRAVPLAFRTWRRESRCKKQEMFVRRHGSRSRMPGMIHKHINSSNLSGRAYLQLRAESPKRSDTN